MIPMTDIAYERLDLYVDGVSLEIATAPRGGEGAPIVFVHGFGSTKEDTSTLPITPASASARSSPTTRPGCGESSCEDLSKLSIPFLVDTAKAVLRKAGIERFHLVGHSMGGLTALLLAPGPGSCPELRRHRGHVAPEDCFLSRQVIMHAVDDAGASSTPSSNGRAIRRSSPARSTWQASGIRSAPAPYAASLTPWSTSPQRRRDDEVALAVLPPHVHVRRAEGLPFLPAHTRRRRRRTRRDPTQRALSNVLQLRRDVDAHRRLPRAASSARTGRCGPLAPSREPS